LSTTVKPNWSRPNMFGHNDASLMADFGDTRDGTM
jgi:hypothetical protein